MPQNQRNAAFTLVELMVSITIVAILATVILVGLAGVQQTAKIQRAKSQIARIHELIATEWESYETRGVAIDSAGGNVAVDHLLGLRELMRLELPDRKSDVNPADALQAGAPITKIRLPAMHAYYDGFVNAMAGGYAQWTTQHQSSECLYMILSRVQVGDSNGLEFFSEREIRDTDGDGMPEILDPWGNPILFVRWPAGFVGPSSFQTGDINGGEDGMDLASADPRLLNANAADDTYAIFPLVFSRGPDGERNVLTEMADPGTGDIVLNYRDTTPLTNDPYVASGTGQQLGEVEFAGRDGHLDNIYNHALTTGL